MLFQTQTTLAVKYSRIMTCENASHVTYLSLFFYLLTSCFRFMSGYHTLEGCGGVQESTAVTFQVPEIRTLTGEEQKQVCKLALKTAANQFSIDKNMARCYVSDQSIAQSETEDGNGRRLQTGMYDISGVAVLNFDYSVPPDVVNVVEIAALSKAASATASGKSSVFSLL